jgi:hypothetical protein
MMIFLKYLFNYITTLCFFSPGLHASFHIPHLWELQAFFSECCNLQLFPRSSVGGSVLPVGCSLRHHPDEKQDEDLEENPMLPYLEWLFAACERISPCLMSNDRCELTKGSFEDGC